MNESSVSGSRHPGWRTIAAAAALGTATAVVVVPAGSAAGTSSGDRPCFMYRAHWNTALDGPQPVCPLK
ncbi:hypothetical protein GCM10009844_02050 [Nocardioides koreensis]|uniref:Uncharacterized protein n=1 Tax=Nocardioides koreensis TaxID=433651 RepID=A0ABN2Z349_9ACTN